MTLNDFQIGLIAGLDGTKSKEKLNQDIETLKRQLDNIEIQAKLGKNAVANLTKQLNSTQITLSNVNIDQAAINKMISQINSALSKVNINIGGNVLDNNSLSRSAQNIGRQTGNLISREVENSLKNITSKEIGVSFKVDKTDSDEFNRAVDNEIRKIQKAKNKLSSVNYTTNTEQQPILDWNGNPTGEYKSIEKLTGAVFKYSTATGEAITKTMKWAQIGTTLDDNGNDVPLMGWVQGLTRYNKALDESVAKVDNFADKQSRAVTKAQNALSSIQSEYNDKNSAKPIKDSGNISNLDNQVRKVETAITNLGNADRTTFTDMQNKVDTQISHLKDMVREYRNAETVATSLRSKDIDTVKEQYSSKLDVLTNKMQSSGAYTNDFRNEAENLKNILSSATDASDLTQFLNRLDKLDAGFKRAKSASDEFNKSQKVAINVSGLESKINELQRIDPTIVQFNKEIAGADVSVQSLRDDLANVQTQGDFSVVNAKLKAFVDAAKAAGYVVKEVTTNIQKIDDIKLSLSSNLFSSQIDQLKSQFQQFGSSADEAENKVKELRNILATMENSSDADLVASFKQWKTQIKSVNAQLKETKTQFNALNETTKIQEAINVGDYDTKLSRLTESYRKLGLESQDIASRTKAVSKALSKLKNPKEVNNLVENEKAFNTELKKSQNEVVQLKGQLYQIYNPNKQFKLSTDIQNWLSKNTRASKDAKSSLEAYYRELSSGNVSVDRLDYIEKKFKSIDAEQRGLKKLGKSLKDQFSQGIQDFTQWASISSMVVGITYKIKESISELKKMDDILTEISKTSDRTKDELKDLGNESFSRASKYGKNVADWLTGVQEMNRSGFQGDVGNNMADLSVKAQAAGDLTRDVADSYLLAMNAAYDYQGNIEKLTNALDGMNQITNVNSTDMNTMASAITKAGSTASTTGVKINELSAMIGTISARTKESGEEVGTGIKSLLINLQNTSSDKIVKTLNKANASMTETKNGIEQLRSPIAILKDLQKTFNSLDAKDPLKSEILTNIGQKYHANELSALLSGWSDYEKMLNDYAGGMGSSEVEAKKSAENWSGSLNKLSNSFTELINQFTNTNAIIDCINILNGLLNVVTNLTKSLGALPLVISSVYTAFSKSGGLIQRQVI